MDNHIEEAKQPQPVHPMMLARFLDVMHKLGHLLATEGDVLLQKLEDLVK